MSDETKRKNRRTIVGFVTSDKGDKSITVSLDRMVQHPRYKKYVRKQSRYYAHDENNEAHEGDRVSIVECRPLSKNKSFRLVEILERSRLRVTTTGTDRTAEGWLRLRCFRIRGGRGHRGEQQKRQPARDQIAEGGHHRLDDNRDGLPAVGTRWLFSTMV